MSTNLIPQHFIDELNNCDIVDVIAARVDLKKSGANWQACCPFHEEKTPSFNVNPSKNFYHCFGCGASGGPIKFVQEMDGLTFPNAVKQLAASRGLIVPNIRDDFNAKNPPTPQNPNATADAYLRDVRGFDISKIKGWYRQDSWHSGKHKKGSETVLFDIDRTAGVSMERFTEDVVINDNGARTVRKQTFKGKYKGLYWKPPVTFDVEKPIYICEAIIDAISLNLNGYQAVASLSTVNYPTTLFTKYPDADFVLAFDSDKSGRAATLKHIKTMRDAGLSVTAALPAPGNDKKDWNDLHQTKHLTPLKMVDYLHWGALLVANSPSNKALEIYNRRATKSFNFDFNNRLYWFNLDIDKYDKLIQALADGHSELDVVKNQEEFRTKALQQCGAITELANCLPKFLYFQRNDETDESWYFAKIDFPHGGPTVKNTFSGSQVSGAGDFKKRLLSIASGALFKGNSAQLDRYTEKELYNLKVVETIDYVGYSPSHKAYVLPKLAIQDDKVCELNNEDYFDLPNAKRVKTLQMMNISIGSKNDYSDDWLPHLWDCFGAKGVAALTFWFGSLFAEQIRGFDKSFPFLEVVGEPGSGKTTLIEFLWKLVGRVDYEGFDPSKSTLAARSRNMSQVSNFPVVLLEGDRDDNTAHAKKFDWDELKTAYNGRASRSRGVKNSGNQTQEPPFRGSIIITQNATVSASEAILQRIVHATFTKEKHSPVTRAAAEKLERYPIDQLSYFYVKAVSQSDHVLEVMKQKTPVYEQRLFNDPDIKSSRIAKNHAQMIALLDALRPIAGLDQDQVNATAAEFKQMAIARQKAIGADHPMVSEFWDALDFLGLNDQIQRVNHSGDPSLIAINLNQFVELSVERKQQIPPICDLKKVLKTSRQNKFVDVKSVHSAIENKTKKCWVFQRSHT